MLLESNKKLTYLTELPKEIEKIEVGAVIPAGNSTLKAIYTPGHSAGHTSFYEEDLGLLFSGDFLLPDVVPYPGAWLENGRVVSGLPSYLRALARVEFLGARAYFPSHGKGRRLPAARCVELRNQILRQVERYAPRETIYEGSLELSKGRFNPLTTFVHLHYVYGWHSLKFTKLAQKTAFIS